MSEATERYFYSEGVPFVRVRTPNSVKVFRLDGSKRVHIDNPRAAAEMVLTSDVCSKERALELAEEI